MIRLSARLRALVCVSTLAAVPSLAHADHGPGASGGGSQTISGQTLQQNRFELTLREDYSPSQDVDNADLIPRATTTGDFDPRLSLTPEPGRTGDAETSPSTLYGCACGCGVFDVGTSSMLPEGPGGVVWFEYDYQNQNHNWKGNSRASAANNDDKAIRTHFFQVGLQYFFNRKWGVEVEVPFDHRTFKSRDEAGNPAATSWNALGDIRLKGFYTGFFEDLSLGVDFGVKLPTGDFTHSAADRDTQIGTGSTDILLGGYYRTHLTDDHRWTAFFQVETDLPVLIQNAYRPGFEADAAAGIYYSGFSFQRVKIIPIGQTIVSERTSDSGANSAHPVASGYQRILLSPGVELQFDHFSIYGDVEFPVFQHMTGDQLVAPMLFKVIVSYSF